MGYELIGKITVLNDTEANIGLSTGTLAEMRFARRTSDNALGISIDNGYTWNFLGLGGGSSIFPIQDDSVFVVSGTAISFDKDLLATGVGSIAHVSVPAGTFASGTHTHPVGETAIQIFDDSVFKATGTAISFNNNLSVVSTGTVAFVNSSAISETNITSLSGTSTVTGWSSYTIFEIYYKKVGNQVTIWFNIEGTSNSTSTNFTVPAELACAVSPNTFQQATRISNNGIYAIGLAVIGTSNTQIDFYATLAGGGFSATGSKTINGTLTYATS